ncbi:MAG: dihydrolipoyl dehydrogenase [Polyangia bacterium]|mgnify:CR=1 FL=1|jgi:dihydrolipoamide dehydrogenase|nr:dihydrolipoyl dehydrogenase [Polyangia bacterium]
MRSFDVAVIGAGPGGYVAAIRAAQLGMKVAIVEKEARLGGTCLNIGCIPSKALLRSSELYFEARHHFAEHGIEVAGLGLNIQAMLARKARIVTELTDGIALLVKKNKVTVVRGRGRLVAKDRVAVTGEGGEEEIQASSLILAAGSVTTLLPGLPVDGERIVTSTEALSFERVPEHLLVVGGGAIGLELGSVWRRLGARVTVAEMMPQIVPQADSQAAKLLQRSLKGIGLDIRTKTQVTAVERKGDLVEVTLRDDKGKEETLGADRVLVAVGRRPCTEGLGLEEVGVLLDERGRVQVDERLATNVPGVFAIGDLVPGPMLAHKASEEGVAVVERLAGLPGHVSYGSIPNVVYTWPELAQAGLSEDEAEKMGLEVKTGRFYFKANGRSKTMGMDEGFVKLVADAGTGALLGAAIVGPGASDLIAEVVMALEKKATVTEVANMVHAHPTLAEAIKEAALAVDKRAIHG